MKYDIKATLPAIQTVKYDIKANRLLSLSIEELIHYVHQLICKRIQLLRSVYHEKLKRVRKKRKRKQEKLGVALAAKKYKISVHERAEEATNKVII